jgi:phosphoglycolate phosphatase-like HAD superfamily hydrolase
LARNFDSAGRAQSESIRRRIVICDVDGTLCDVREIRRHVDPLSSAFTGTKDFPRFHAESLNAPAHGWVVKLITEIASAGVSIAIVTGREERWSFLTSLWLAEHGVPYDEIHFRTNGDFRADRVVKAEILARIQIRNDTVLAIDDSLAVVELWKEHAIPTLTIREDGLPDHTNERFLDQFAGLPASIRKPLLSSWHSE